MASERVQRKVGTLLDEAEEALTRHDWRTARDRAETALALDHENQDARQYLEAAEFGLRGASRQLPTVATVADIPSPDPGSSDAPPPQVVSSQPSSFASGRYSVKKLIGQGGKKRVFLAHDTILDRDVAFALIKTDGLDETAMKRITREAQAMGRLGDHPNIVPIFDLGQEPDPATGTDQPFMVLPLMTGGDVEGLIEKAPDHRLPLERAIQIARDTCDGLEFAHSLGVVHRDLKPGNVWLTQDGRARIGDFGLAVATDRSRLTREGTMVGTVAYMPPEQALGGEVTPQADLYSLGCMLYEMVAGRPPFVGDSDVAIIGQHINTPPVSPMWHRSDCPKPLEALIIRLLAKDPSQRPASAAAVRAELDAIDTSDAAAAAQRLEHREGEAKSLDSLAAGVFVGRQAEVTTLRAALEDALLGRGRLVMLGGDPGIGKTRTAAELVTYASLRKCRVLWGRCYEAQGAPPYWPWVQALRSYVREEAPDQLRDQLGTGIAEIAEIVPDVREAFAGLKPPPQLANADEARFRLFDAVSTFLRAASTERPIVIILDDLHWADRPSLLLLEFVARELAGACILIIGTYRDVELSRGHPLANTLGELSRERLYDRVLLRGLTEDDVASYIEMTAGLKPPPELAAAIHAQTEGNPLFVTEVVRLLVQEGQLTPEKIRWGGQKSVWTSRIPEGIKEVIGRRLNRLTRDCLELLTTAALLGRDFSLAQLRAAGPETASETGTADALDEAAKARILEELPGGGRFQFAHGLVQETLLADLPAGTRVRLHARIARALEALYGQDAEAHANELAHHYGRASGLIGGEGFVRYALIAGEQALATSAFEDALRLFGDAKGTMPADATESRIARTVFGLGRAQAGLFQWEGAWTSLKQAFDTFERTGDTAGAIAVAAYPFPATWLHGVTELIQAALKMAEPGSPDQARILARLGLIDGVEVGDYVRGAAGLEQALATARQLSDQHLELSVLTDWVQLDMFHLRWEESRPRVAEVIRLGRLLNRPHNQFMGHVVAFNAHFAEGNAAASLEDAEGALACGKRVRDPHSIEAGYLSTARAHMVVGRFGMARQASDRGLELWPEDPRMLGVRAILESTVGDTEATERFLAALAGPVQSGQGTSTPVLAYVAASIPLARLASGGDGHLDIAVKALGQLPESATRVGGYALPSMVGQGVMAIIRSDADSAARVYEQVRTMSGAVLFGISDLRLQALLASTFGDSSLALSLFEQGVAYCGRAGYRPELAWTLNDYATVHEGLERPDGAKEAARLRDESLSIARELGMKTLIERIIARKTLLRA